MARSPVPSAHQALDAGVHSSARGRSSAVGLFLSLRPRQWTKNVLVFAGLIFGQKLLDPAADAMACAAFAVFCVLSGVVYLINDVRDREADQLHPVKARRPIASGAVAPSTAVAAAAILAACGAGAAFAMRWQFGAVALAYLLLQGLYSVSFKHVVILDVLSIALGFVLRAVAGTMVLDVPISHWLLVCTLLGALFLALSKRRAELVSLAGDATNHRKSLRYYSPELLDQMISIVAASTLLAYAFYAISPETIAKFGTENLVLTLPFPLYGLFRYLYLLHQRDGGGDPSETLLHDRPILACVALWALADALIIYRPWP
jgi:4-hydroxybenzoate polyprenyltransferase